ncbi:MAG: CAP domain-containing protein [Deltaproteobacteria bacterium]|nr:CAP domain-containing protein [Deltaproteobacteria bacterium]
MRLRVLGLLLAATIATTVARADDAGARPAERPEKQALRLVNAYRAAAGLPPVKLDAKLSKGCMEHAAYMRANRGTDAMAGLNAHTQRPNLPGATPAGAACGKAADLFPGVSDLQVAVDGWMASLYHRRPVLTPSLARIGVGYARLPDGSLMAALMFVNDKDATPARAVMYPADRQTDVPLEFGNEVPNPIPGNGRGGYPITLQFPAFDPVTAVKATFTDGKGHKVPFYLSDPEHPATSFGQYGVICVIPKVPLAASSRYTVAIDATWNGQAGHWSTTFTTLSLRAVDAADESAIAQAVGVASRVRGTVLQGGEIDGGTVFLQIGQATGKRYKMVSVMMPPAVWREVGGGAEPSTWTGKTVEVEATPVVVGKVYANLPISVAAQVRVIAAP